MYLGRSLLDNVNLFTYKFTYSFRLRHRTWTRLKELEDGVLSRVLAEILAKDPISPILNDTHLSSLDRRLKKLLEVIETCIHKHGQSKVLLEDEFS